MQQFAHDVEHEALTIARDAETILAPIAAGAAIAGGDALLQAVGSQHFSGTLAIAAPFLVSAAVAYWQAKIRPFLAARSAPMASGASVSSVGHAGSVEAVALPALPIVDPVLVTNLIEDALRQYLAEHATAGPPTAS